MRRKSKTSCGKLHAPRWEPPTNAEEIERAPAITPGLKRQAKCRFALDPIISPQIEAVNTLYSRGARLFRLDDENRPAEAGGFYDRQLSLDALLAHVERRGRLGIEPRSLDTVVVDVDDGDGDRFIHNFPPLSLCKSRTPGRFHLYYRHSGGRISPRPFNAPVFGIKGDLKYERSYVALYDAPRLAEDLNRGPLGGVPYVEVEQALVTGSPAALGGQRGPLTPPAGVNASPGDAPPSPGRLRHDWIYQRLTAGRVDGMKREALRRYAVELHTALIQPPGPVPHYFPLSEALRMAWDISNRDYSPERQSARGVLSGQARRAKSAGRDRRIVDMINAGISIRRIAEDIEVSRRTVARVRDRKDRRGA